MPRKKVVRNVAVIDYETDPFLYGRVPEPFAAGFFDGTAYKEFWGDGCVQELVDYLTFDRLEPLRIYAHNGGKFDFFLMLEHLENPLKIINGRIVKAKLGIHEVQDSYAIIPVGLAAYKKDEIDYALFERDQREANRGDILHYLAKDCEYLFEMVSAFESRFGNRLTIGGTAIKELKKYHPFDNQGQGHDTIYRPYYFGGRVEFFDSGILKGDWKIYDVNSMYPHVMAAFDHPCGSDYVYQRGGILDRKGRISGMSQAPVYYANIECENNGAFPTRSADGTLTFNQKRGEFNVTSHELQAAVACNLVADVKIISARYPRNTIKFADYVSVFSAEKIAAKKCGDKIGEIFAKLLLNSAYGKTGQSPDNYFDFELQRPGDDYPRCNCGAQECKEFEPHTVQDENYSWELYSTHDSGVNIWRTPSKSRAFYDVAIAASITGAARSVLMRAIAAAKRPAYCDTDSLICEGLDMPLSEYDLGAWKLEGKGDTLAIAGKKMYALYDQGECVKLASKGVRMKADDIVRVCKGETFHWEKASPSFSLSHGARFIHRKIQSRIPA